MSMGAFLLRHSDGYSFRLCAICANCRPREKGSDGISTYSSLKAAADCGWVFTRAKRFSKNGRSVSVCPGCASNISVNDREKVT